MQLTLPLAWLQLLCVAMVATLAALEQASNYMLCWYFNMTIVILMPFALRSSVLHSQ